MDDMIYGYSLLHRYCQYYERGITFISLFLCSEFSSLLGIVYCKW